MGRKSNKYGGKHEKSSRAEKEKLLTVENNTDNNISSTQLGVPGETEKKNRPERKKSAWAPVATATAFEDVPVFTICPYCTLKVVTKTQFKKGKKHLLCCCCCLPYFLDVFKDVIHICPKCNTQIAIYNRFQFFSPRDAGGAAEETIEYNPTTD